MPKCKICGGVVRTGEVVHKNCRKREMEGLQNENGQPMCVTGKSPSGLCSCCRADGKVCCIGCKEDCNIRCGWAWIRDNPFVFFDEEKGGDNNGDV